LDGTNIVVTTVARSFVHWWETAMHSTHSNLQSLQIRTDHPSTTTHIGKFRGRLGAGRRDSQNSWKSGVYSNQQHWRTSSL